MVKSQTKQDKIRKEDLFLVPSRIDCNSAPSAVVNAAAKSASFSESDAFIVANH